MTRLHFYGPYALCSDERDVLADCPHASATGLYLWAVPTMDHGLVVDYVGETSTSFYQRTKEHVIQTLGGNYLLLDPDAAIRGRREVVWPGLWRTGTRDQLPRYLARLDELAHVAKRYLLLHQILVAPVVCDRRLRQRMEASIAAAILAVEPRLVAEDIRYRGRGPDDDPIEVSITSDCTVSGLPSSVTV
jgi:hypothetical protein